MNPIFGPLSYLRLQYKRSLLIQIVVPALVSIGIFSLVWPLEIIEIRGDNGLVQAVNYLIAFTIGFFIAALAAISSLSDPRLDEPTSGFPVRAKIVEKKKVYWPILSRRQYLTRLFGYLAYISVVLYISGTFSQLIDKNWPSYNQPYISIGFSALAIYLFGFSSLIINMFIGIYYFSDKIHRPRSEKIVGDSDETD